MTIAEYQKLAEVTSGAKGYKYQGYIDWKELENYYDDAVYNLVVKARSERRLMAAAMGLCGEVSEYLQSFDDGKDPTNELSDVAWYMAEICSSLGLDLDGVLFRNSYHESKNWADTDLVIAAGNLCDYLKKVTAHGHELDVEKVKILLSRVANNYLAILYIEGLKLEDVLEFNINKLKKRYGDKFSTEASVNRD